MKNTLFFFLLVLHFFSFGQLSRSINYFDYKNINTITFIPMQGWNDEQKYTITVLKRSFEMQHAISCPRDTVFFWTGLVGKKTIYTKDSLILLFLRPADTITRPCILLTHGNTAKYRTSWNENMNFYAIDLAMRGYCVAYYENPSSAEAQEMNLHSNGPFNHIVADTRNAFYNGFQSSVAADIYIKHNAAQLSVDTTKIFASGFSFGAFCSLMLATADPGRNFTDTIFNWQGGYNAKSIYDDPFLKNIHYVIPIGGGLPKDDTTFANNSHMGNFIDGEENNLSILFLHGRTDNLVSFYLTKFGEADTSSTYLWGEGPLALINNIAKYNAAIPSKLFINCRSGHPFKTSVCGYSNPYCLPQWQWQYLPEPMGDLSNTNSYYQDSTRDTLLHYFAYNMTQQLDIGLIMGDFLQPVILNTTSLFTDHLYFLQPRDSFTYANPSGHYILRTTDCEGHAVVVTSDKSHDLQRSTFKMYPNPGNNIITFEANEAIEKISVYSMLGALIKNIDCKNLQEQVDVTSLPSGEYICIIQLNGQALTQKLSIIR